MRGGSAGVDRLIYLIRPVGMSGPIKIGCSEAPEQRLQALAVWSPWPLEVVASFPGSFKLERRIHSSLWRSHSHREWFHPTDEVLSFAYKIIAGAPVEKALDLKVGYRPRGPLSPRDIRLALAQVSA